MSSLQRELKELIVNLSSEANRVKDPEIKKRFYLIKAVCESKKDVKKTCEMRGVSTDCFYDWGRRLLDAGSLLGLKSKSRSVKSFWNKTLPRIEKKIVRIRKREPFKGPDRISFDLKSKYKIDCPPSTVAAILKRKGLVTKEYRDRLTKKHMRRYRRPWPGYLQMDFKFTPFLVENKQCYQLSVVDHHSSWRFIRTYDNRRQTTVVEFLDTVESHCPFAILQIQTDNASEFTDKFTSQGGSHPTTYHVFDRWCEERSIEHKLIPIGQKEINGKVENTHKWDDREFYSQVEVNTISELQAASIEYNQRWNSERPTKTLGWKTPNEVVEEAFARAIAYLRLMLPATAFERPKRALTKIVGNSSIIYASREEMAVITEKLKPQKEAKKISAVDRYLQYLDWEERQKLKTLIPVPVILQKFS